MNREISISNKPQPCSLIPRSSTYNGLCPVISSSSSSILGDTSNQATSSSRTPQTRPAARTQRLSYSGTPEANYGLTASFSTSDINPSTPGTRHLRFAPSTPTRIPTPTYGVSSRNMNRGQIMIHRSISPVLEENKKPIKPHSLLRTISPTNSTTTTTTNLISRSRTVNVLSSVKSSLSRSSLNLSTIRKASYSSETTIVPSSSTASMELIPTFGDGKSVYVAQPSSYWCGRFQALRDKLLNEDLEELSNPDFLQKLTGSSKRVYSGGSSSNPQQQSLAEALVEHMVSSGFEDNDNNKRCRTALLHLSAACVTKEAKQSLWDWQLKYARQTRNEALLPVGSKMIDEKVPWITRMDRYRKLSGGLGASLGTTLGKGYSTSTEKKRWSLGTHLK